MYPHKKLPNLPTLHQAFSRIETKKAAQKLGEAAKVSEKDRDFFDDTRVEQERDRTEGEEELKDQEKEIKETEVRFKEESSETNPEE